MNKTFGCIRTLELSNGDWLGTVHWRGEKSRMLLRDFFGISQIHPYVITQKPLGFGPVTCCQSRHNLRVLMG